jgi:hypothetical protein
VSFLDLSDTRRSKAALKNSFTFLDHRSRIALTSELPWTPILLHPADRLVLRLGRRLGRLAAREDGLGHTHELHLPNLSSSMSSKAEATRAMNGELLLASRFCC